MYWHELTQYEKDLVRSVLLPAVQGERRVIAVRTNCSGLVVDFVDGYWIPERHPLDDGPVVAFRFAPSINEPYSSINLGCVEFNWNGYKHGWEPVVHPDCDDRVPLVPVPVPNRPPLYIYG